MPKKLDLARLLNKASGNVLPVSAVKYLWDNIATRSLVYSITMPITGRPEIFEISNELYYAKCIPLQAHVMTDYFMQAQYIMEHARDYQEMNGDLSPICEEEKRLFGVRENPGNACFPKTRQYVLEQMAEIWRFTGKVYK